MRYRRLPSHLLRRASPLLLLILAACFAQSHAAAFADASPAAAAPATLEAVLRAQFDQADLVFTGEVTAIDQTAAAVEIRWQVETGLRGAVAGQQFILREWAGLWRADSRRYSKGQRALLLLHAPSAAGYASPVGGADGVIALRGDNGSGTLDLSLLQQRVLVTDAARLRPAQTLQATGGSLALSDALQQQLAARQPRARRATTTVAHAAALLKVTSGDDDGTAGSVTPGMSQPPATGAAVDPTRTLDARLVLDLLTAWQRQRSTKR